MCASEVSDRARARSGVHPRAGPVCWELVIPMLCERIHPRVCGAFKLPIPHVGFGLGSTPASAGPARRWFQVLLDRPSSTPRPRGLQVVGDQLAEKLGSIPASAGPAPRRRRRCRSASVYPRVCGACCSTARRAKCPGGLSPRLRGLLEAAHSDMQRHWSIPASAGPSKSGAAARTIPMGHPRVCRACRPGCVLDRHGIRGGLSPRPRGLPVAKGLWNSILAVYPRVRGACVPGYMTLGSDGGLSPHLRGLRDGLRRMGSPTGVYPRFCGACAQRFIVSGTGQGLSPRLLGLPICQ